MRRTLRAVLFAGLAAGLTTIASAASAAGQMEAVARRALPLPQTAWVKAEIDGTSGLEAQLRDAVNSDLARRGYNTAPLGPYSVRIEVRADGVATPTLDVAGYKNSQSRLAIWSAPQQPGAVYLSLLLYHQSSGTVYWQAEAVCADMPADAAHIVNAMVAPMMARFGKADKTTLGCRR